MFQCNSCRIAADGGSFATVKAGEVEADLAICGYETESAKLPRLTAAPQNYSAGFCPGVSLEKGTMFPELADEY